MLFSPCSYLWEVFHLQCSFILPFPSFHSSMMIPGNAAGVAKQFLRCVFHQLAPNGIFPQLFQSNIKGSMWYLSAFLTLSVPFVGLQCKNVIQISDGSFLRTLATSLMDFSELSSIAALSQLLEVCWKSAVLMVLVLLALSSILVHFLSLIKTLNLHCQKL